MNSTTSQNVMLGTGEGKGNLPEPGSRLYHLARAAFIARETNLKSWCVASGVSETTAKAALFGFTKSKAAAELRDRILRAAGLSKDKE